MARYSKDYYFGIYIQIMSDNCSYWFILKLLVAKHVQFML